MPAAAWLALAALAASSAAPTAAAAAPSPPVRVWVDAYGFAPGETLPLRDAVLASPATASLAAYVTAPTLTAKGYWHPSDWDLYWAPRPACERAWAVAPPPRRPACVPGSAALTSKAAAAAAAAAAFGDGGHRGLPVAIDLPRRAWDAAAAAAAAAPGRLFALKAAVHRGAGVAVLDAGAPAAAAAARTRHGGVLQSFVDPQARLAAPDAGPASRPARFYVRAWALLTAASPVPLAYLYDGGFAISGGAPHDGRIVNLWLATSAAATVVRVADLASFVRPVPTNATAWAETLSSDIQAALGAALAAAAGAMASADAHTARPPGALAAQMVGADIAVTPDGRAVLLEVNETPSLARMGKGGAEAAPAPSTAAFDGEKEAAVAALVRFVGEAARMRAQPLTLPPGCEAAADDAFVLTAAAEAAAARATGWIPLAHAVAAGVEAAAHHAAATPRRPPWAAALRRAAESGLGRWAARALAAVAPRALAWAAARGADKGVLGSPDPVSPTEGAVRAARVVARCVGG